MLVFLQVGGAGEATLTAHGNGRGGEASRPLLYLTPETDHCERVPGRDRSRSGTFPAAHHDDHGGRLCSQVAHLATRTAPNSFDGAANGRRTSDPRPTLNSRRDSTLM